MFKAIAEGLIQRAAKLWLTHRAAEADRHKDLSDLMRVSFRDELVRRRAELQLEGIALSVQERLRKLAGHEYAGLGEHDREAVLAEVVRTLADADLSDRALFDVDVDAVKLAARLHKGLSEARKVRELGEAGARLYDVVLAECCDCLVRIVHELPQFQGRATPDMLGRLSTLDARVTEALNRLPVRKLDAPEGTDNDEEFRRRYLEHVSTTLDSLELLGVRLDFAPRTKVSVSYISLTVSADDDPSGALTRHSRPGEDAIPVAAWREEQDGRASASMEVESALARSRLTLVRGEAGGGKSTLLKWLAVTAARGDFSGDLADWNGHVPFLIKLRSHAEGELPRPEEWVGEVAGPIAGLMPAAWAHRILNTSRALLLVDGVDEVTGSRRQRIRTWLRGLVTAYPELRVVVTSRPAAAESAWLANEEFVSVFLERLKPEGVRVLIR